MKQNSVLESTRKVREMPLEFTRTVMEQKGYATLLLKLEQQSAVALRKIQTYVLY
ncbi:hypothetical protein [Lacrimispora sp.]|uniref:hypothetical protein n=1 Tax=Lacrimispora sp. TaxID=2719234 RepID=UPI00285F2A66|nr:hypothetical protein [Lacrimispora sp.]MDR7811298.1 hypothetical protein [Lacrimispora sp.]